MEIEKTKNLMVDLIMREKYSPLAMFDRSGDVHLLDQGSGEVQITPRRVEDVVDIAPNCSCKDEVGAIDEGTKVKADPIKGGVSDIPASFGGQGGCVGNLLDVFG